MKTVLLILALMLVAPTARSQDNCLNYEPDVMTITGTIKTRVAPGPPNYESVAKGDTPEKIWLLQLTSRICVAAKDDAAAENNVTDLQLVFPEGQKQYDEYRSFKGRRVSVTGTLFHAETGHHHTRVLLTVTSIKKL